MKTRVTLALTGETAAYLQRCAKRTGGNVSAYVEAHFREQALHESVRAHTAWFQANPTYAADADAERTAGAA